MNRHEFLTGLHAAYRPRTYLEIGVNDGRGLARSSTRTIGVDPDFKVTAELACDLQLAHATSDDFFDRPDPIAWFPEGVIDLAFIDGLHIFEFALRDFMNCERLATPASVVVFDDMLPRTIDEAARDRHTLEWAGDVYKVWQVLRKYRPDLVLVQIDTQPTGLLVVVGLDPRNTTLADHYDEILAEYALADPQVVPDDIIHRRSAADPVQILQTTVWADLVAARTAGSGHPESLQALVALHGTAGYVSNPPQAHPWPPKPKSVNRPKPPAPPKPIYRRLLGKIRRSFASTSR